MAIVFGWYEKDRKLRALQDCVLFLQAQKLGLVALTANVGDYDILLQLVPLGSRVGLRILWASGLCVGNSRPAAAARPLRATDPRIRRSLARS